MFGFKLPASRFKVRAVIPAVPHQHSYDISSLSQKRSHIISLVAQIFRIDGKFRSKLSVVRTYSVHAELICSVACGIDACPFYTVSCIKFFAKIFCPPVPGFTFFIGNGDFTHSAVHSFFINPVSKDEDAAAFSPLLTVTSTVQL